MAGAAFFIQRQETYLGIGDPVLFTNDRAAVELHQAVLRAVDDQGRNLRLVQSVHRAKGSGFAVEQPMVHPDEGALGGNEASQHLTALFHDDFHGRVGGSHRYYASHFVIKMEDVGHCIASPAVAEEQYGELGQVRPAGHEPQGGI